MAVLWEILREWKGEPLTTLKLEQIVKEKYPDVKLERHQIAKILKFDFQYSYKKPQITFH